MITVNALAWIVIIICIIIIIVNTQWWENKVASRFYPFEITNKTNEPLQYKYTCPRTGENITGKLNPGEKHTNKDLNAFDKMELDMKPLSEVEWKSRIVGRDARRVSIVDDNQHLGNLRKSVLQPNGLISQYRDSSNEC